jgi:uncharacterized protein (TIGR01777 family)
MEMHILITGGTGFIGGPLCECLLSEGHQLTLLTRQALVDMDHCRYVSKLETLDTRECFDAVINLAGASMSECRWTPEYKREIFASRLETTRALLQFLERVKQRPKVLLSASAIGYYGHHGDEELEESGATTPGFAQDLCEQWEQLALSARQLDMRVCTLRLGVVIDSGGGAFAQMARPFNFGVANWLGSGRQWLSWVHRADVISAMHFLLRHTDLQGPFNITAPQPVTSRGFCEAMKLHKRTLFSLPVPEVIMRLMVGEMAEELLLNGQRVVPAALQQAGFTFDYPDLNSALAKVITT